MSRAEEEFMVKITQQATELGEQDARIEKLEEALRRIEQWSRAYPMHIFPALDDDYMRRASEALIANGMTLDRIAADCMRHVVQGVGKIAREALEP